MVAPDALSTMLGRRGESERETKNVSKKRCVAPLRMTYYTSPGHFSAKNLEKGIFPLEFQVRVALYLQIPVDVDSIIIVWCM